MQRPKPVMLMILDGWGIDTPGSGNAVTLANTPNLDRLVADYPHTQLKTCGKSVGLPEGIMGNSEVGASEYRRRTHCLPGPVAHRQRNCRRLLF